MCLLRIEKRYINIDYNDKKKKILSDMHICKKPAKKYIKKIVYGKEKTESLHDIFNPEIQPYTKKISTVLIEKDICEKKNDFVKNISKNNKIEKYLTIQNKHKSLNYKINSNIEHTNDKDLSKIKNDVYSNWIKKDKEYFENAQKYNQVWYEKFMIFLKNFLKSLNRDFLINFIKIKKLYTCEIKELEKLDNEALATIIINNILENFKIKSIFSIYTLMIFFLCQYYIWHRKSTLKSALKEVKWIEDFNQSNSYTKKMIVKMYLKGVPFDTVLPSNSIQSMIFRRISRLNPWIINNNVFYINRINNIVTNSRWGNGPISIFVLLARCIRWFRGY